MSEFLTHMILSIPPDLPDYDNAVQKLLDQEAEAARRYLDEGSFTRVWREPGTRNHWALWTAPDADFIHRAYASFPLFRYMQVEVHALALNTNDPPTRRAREAEAFHRASHGGH